MVDMTLQDYAPIPELVENSRPRRYHVMFYDGFMEESLEDYINKVYEDHGWSLVSCHGHQFFTLVFQDDSYDRSSHG